MHVTETKAIGFKHATFLMQHVCHYNVISNGLHIERHKPPRQALIDECLVIALVIVSRDRNPETALGLTKTAAIECGRYGIRVNAVSPGAVRTEMLLEVFDTQEALDEMSAVYPIGRIGRPEEIADAVAWLFSERSSYYTGQSLILDGGLTAQRPYVTQPTSEKSPALAEERMYRPA
jgi:hypothetical protein